MQQLTFSFDYLHQEDTLLINIAPEFTQDDCSQLTDTILARWSNASLVEIVEGADRYCARVKYNNGIYLLNFEIYSQSCWLEAESPENIHTISQIKFV